MTIVPAGEFTTEPATAMRAAAQIPISYSSTFADWERPRASVAVVCDSEQ